MNQVFTSLKKKLTYKYYGVCHVVISVTEFSACSSYLLLPTLTYTVVTSTFMLYSNDLS